MSDSIVVAVISFLGTFLTAAIAYMANAVLRFQQTLGPSNGRPLVQRMEELEIKMDALKEQVGRLGIELAQLKVGTDLQFRDLNTRYERERERERKRLSG